MGAHSAVKALIEANADLEKLDVKSNSIIIFFARGENKLCPFCVFFLSPLQSCFLTNSFRIRQEARAFDVPSRTMFVLHLFSPRSTDAEIPSPLGAAAETGHLQVIQCLVQAGAKKNQPGPGGRTPLWCAAASGHLFCVRWSLGGARVKSKL